MTRLSPAARADASSFLACAAFVALAALAPQNDWMRAARGEARIGREIRSLETRGYYEALIDANRGPAAADSPPPGWVPFGASGIVEPISSYLRWRMRPNLDMTWNGVPFRTNSRGYRTPEVAVPKPDGVYRIVVFGSSNTMGHGVGDEEAYPRLMEPWLDGRTDPGVRVELVNLSVSGDSPSRRLARMAEEAEAYQPDWLLCDASVLDPALEEMHLEAVVRAEPRPEIPAVLDHVRQALERSGASPADSPAALRKKLQGEAQSLLEESYKGWAEQARNLGVPLTVVIIPRADAKLANPALDEIIHAAIRREGLDALDLGDAFADLEPEEFRVSPWDKHPSARGHRAIFDAFCAAMQARGALPGLDLED